MPKSRAARRVRSGQALPPVELLGDVEGQIEEICHDIAVQVKRMTQLREQAGELRSALRRLVGPAGKQ